MLNPPRRTGPSLNSGQAHRLQFVNTMELSKRLQREIQEDLVNEILSIKKQNHSANITALEPQIDQLVYQLYDLTEEEIKIIEANG